MKKYFLVTSLVSLTFFIFSPALFAQGTAQDISAGFNTFAGLVTLFTTTIIRTISTLLLSLAVVAFFYGIVQYIWGLREGNATKTATGNQFMIWGLVGLFVMFSVYGIIKFGQGILFNGKDVSSIVIPELILGGKGGTSGPSSKNTDTGGSTSGPSSQNLQTNPLGGSSPNTQTGLFSSYSCTAGKACVLPYGVGSGTCNSKGDACIVGESKNKVLGGVGHLPGSTAGTSQIMEECIDTPFSTKQECEESRNPSRESNSTSNQPSLPEETDFYFDKLRCEDDIKSGYKSHWDSDLNKCI